ncbi:MAG: thioesterase family protein [Bacteroidota bacterium]
MTHTSRLTPRWSDLDAYGHLNNAVYLTLCEQARIDALGRLGEVDWSASGPVVVAASVQYRRPVTDTAPLRVEVAFGAPGRTSLPTSYRVTSDDGATLYAEAEATMVWVETATGRPTPLPEAVRMRLDEAG